MSNKEHFNYFYKGLCRKDFSIARDIIQNCLWKAYDQESGELLDKDQFLFAYNQCKSAYNNLKEYEDQIEEDLREINGEFGTPMLSYDDVPGIQDMAFICDAYHQYFEAFNDSTIETLTKANDSPKYQENEIMSDETPKIEANSNEKEIISLKIDQKSEHRKWFVKILNSKIPIKPNKDRDHIIYENLNKLYKELSDSGLVNPNEEDKTVFIYRFSGFNGPFPPERKIKWNGENVFLGYIVRCLITDTNNKPMAFGTVASFFLSPTHVPMNFSTADNYTVKDFEKERNKLDPQFVKAVELLKKCGFINVEFTSARR